MRKAIFRLGILILACDSALAQDRQSAPVTAPQTSPEMILQFPAAGFTPFDSRMTWAGDGNYVLGDVSLGSTVHLPNGALITACNLYYNDINYRIGASLVEHSGGTGATDPYITKVLCSVTSSPGRGVRGATIDPPVTVSNSNQYTVEVGLQCGAAYPCSSLRSVDIRYHLQMGPAPTTATFADVPPGYTYFRAIEALAGAGITSGCGNGNFCPEKTVTRGELAKFLAVGMGLNWPE